MFRQGDVQDQNGGAPAVPQVAGAEMITLKNRNVTAALGEALPAVTVPAVGLPAPLGTQESFLVRRRWSILIGAVVTTALIVAAILLLAPSGPNPDNGRAVGLMTSSKGVVDRVLGAVSQANARDGLEAAGSTAQTSLTSLGRFQAQLVQIKSTRVRVPVTQMLQAQTALVQGFSRLEEAARRQGRLGEWRQQIRQQVQLAQTNLATATTAVQALKLKNPQTLVVAPGDVDRAVQQVESVVSRAGR
jgi:hypothetical protein